MKTLSNRRNQKHSSQKHRDAHVLVSGLSGFCTLFSNLCSFFVQTKELLVLGVVIFGHENRARRRLSGLERIGAQPGCECGPVLVAKAPLEKLRRLCLAIQFCSEPTIEGIAVVNPLLSRQGGKAFGSDSEPT